VNKAALEHKAEFSLSTSIFPLPIKISPVINTQLSSTAAKVSLPI
jgi:hypothetical protein